MFRNQMKNSGLGALFAVGAVLVAWVALAAVMLGTFLNPPERIADSCERICRAPDNGSAHT